MAIFLGLVLLSSLLTFNPSLAASANFTFPSDPSDGNLSQTPSVGSNNPAVAISGTDIFVIWQEDNKIYFSKSPDSGDNFSTSISIGDSGTTIPKLTAKGDNVYAIWSDSKNIEFNRSLDGGLTFGGAEVQLSSLSSASPQITVADNVSSNPDDVYAVWSNDDGAADIFFIKSSNNGTSFTSVLDIGNTDFTSPDPKIATTGDNVYVIWQNQKDIMFARSTNNGDSFTISDIGDSTDFGSAESFPDIVSTENFVYAVWQEKSNIKFSQSNDYGVTFTVPKDIGDSGGTTRDSNPKLAFSGNDVYVLWRDGVLGSGDIKFIKSSNNGIDFGSEINLSNNSGESSHPAISVSGTNVFVTWEDSTLSSGVNKDVLFNLSTNGGDSFGTPSSVVKNDGDSEIPTITSLNDTAYIVWENETPGKDNPFDIFFKKAVISPINISFDKPQYRIGEDATITIVDDSNSNAGSIITNVISDTDSVGINATLTEGPIGTFSGKISFTESGSSSGTTLHISSGDTITASFSSTEATASIFAASISLDSDLYNFGSIAAVTVIDQSANNDPSSYDTVPVVVTSDLDSISLTLNETAPNSGEFSGNVAFMIDNKIIPATSDLKFSVLDCETNIDPSEIDSYNMTVWSSSDPTGIELSLLETGINTNEFTGTLHFSSLPSNPDTSTLFAVGGDFYTVEDPTASFPAVGLLTPNPNISNGAIVVSEISSDPLCAEDLEIKLKPKISSVTATYKSFSDSATVYDQFGGGGGGGGLVRPSLVVNALGGLGGGGSAYSSPTLQLSNLVLLGNIEVPPEVEQMVLNHDSTIPQPAFSLDYFENFDWPLIIDDKGFILSGYTTTLETQNLKTNIPHTFKFLFYETEKIQHFSLYMNLRDAYTSIPQSDTQILYNDGFGTDIMDPNGYFENVTLAVNEIDNIKKEVVLDITFAKEMDTTDMIVRAWDPMLNSFDTYILDAIKVVPEEEIESPTPTYSEPVISELKSTTIPLWIKSNAAWWSDQQISDDDFVAGLEYLIKNGIINVPGVEVSADSTATQIPDWIQNNAGWWADSLISDDDFIEAMQWLIANGVIQI